MAVEKHGILGQVQPAANTDANVIAAVAAGRKVTVTTLVVANDSGTTVSYRVHARIAGAAAASGNRIVPDVSLGPNASDGLTWGITLGPTDILTVRANNANVTFTAFGVEEDLV